MFVQLKIEYDALIKQHDGLKRQADENMSNVKQESSRYVVLPHSKFTMCCCSKCYRSLEGTFTRARCDMSATTRTLSDVCNRVSLM